MPLETLFSLKKDASTPKISSYAYRCFDRHFAIEDIRFNDRMGEILWRLQGGVQLYLTALATEALGSGQGIIASAAVPDLHHFRGSRSEEHTSELQSLMRISYAVFCLKKKNITD